MNTIIVFIEKEISELQLVSFLQDHLKITIESDEVGNGDAKAYMQYTQYEDDFATMIILSSTDVLTEEKTVAKDIASAFETKTLIELPDGFNYLLIDKNGYEKQVKITESETGIKIQP